MAMAKGQGGHGAWPMPCSMSRASVPHRACDVDGPMHGPWRRDRVPDVYTVLCVGQRTYAVARARAVR